MKELIAIQSELKAPKNQVNKFGGYNYRSAEDILEAVKPLNAKHGCVLTLSDTVKEIGGRVYIEATATLVNADGQVVQTSAFAREEETKKGMDAAQITGSASSYARKYALNGLFCIDDTKDPDATNTHLKETVIREDVMDKDFEKCTDRNDLVAVWNKYKGTALEEQAKKVLRKRKQELGIEK